LCIESVVVVEVGVTAVVAEGLPRAREQDLPLGERDDRDANLDREKGGDGQVIPQNDRCDSHHAWGSGDPHRVRVVVGNHRHGLPNERRI
jgi:hypothetical protein